MPLPHDPDAARAALDHTPTSAFLGGDWIDTGNQLDVYDPASATVITTVSDCGPDRFIEALDIAAAHQREFAKWAPRERSEVLRRAYELMTAERDRLALVMTLEMGKPLTESLGEVAYAAEFFRWFSEEACRVEGDYRPAPSGSGRILVSHRPVGPCLLITPWNFPLAMGARKVAPAIAAGCTAILKPAQNTPLSSLAMADILERAGLPAGALSVLPTSHSGAAAESVIGDERLRKLSFTGSTPVGRTLLRQAADGILRVSMELGGNAPLLVFDDADLDVAVDGAMAAKMRNGGEACTSANRMLVHRAVADEFIDRLTRRMAALNVGHGSAPGVELGPMITEKARDEILRKVEEARSAGAEILTGGTAPDHEGWFMDATVVVGAPLDGTLNNEEVFGPVATVFTFDDEDEAVAKANATPYGLVSFAFTTDLARALRLSESLEAGMIGINRGVVSDPGAPFGGIKSSGLGREGGRTGIHEYLEPVYVALPD
ncbi:MAG: NAD-dependent succinate-semialdehyde dehydrogenase [Aquihabitans sp.]